MRGPERHPVRRAVTGVTMSLVGLGLVETGFETKTTYVSGQGDNAVQTAHPETQEPTLVWVGLGLTAVGLSTLASSRRRNVPSRSV